jgi:alginate biosynthesis protein Alg44
MQPQIVHESEVHRQHIRLKIPIQVEVDGVRYQVDDWSVGGFGVESVMTSRQPGERFSIRLIFPFEEFEMTMRLDARMVYVDQDHGRFGCAFTGMTKEHGDIFRYLVDAYLAGEVVSAGDILQVRARDNTAAARLQPGYEPFLEDESWAVKLRHYGALAGFGLAGLALLAVVALGLKEHDAEPGRGPICSSGCWTALIAEHAWHRAQPATASSALMPRRLMYAATCQ